MNKFSKTIFGLVILVALILITKPMWQNLFWGSSTDEGDATTDKGATNNAPPVIEAESADGASMEVKYPKKSYNIDPNNHPAARVQSRETLGVFEIIGKGKSSKWSILESADFTYFLTISTESRILKTDPLTSGRIRIEEKRTFNLVRDDIIANNADIQLDLDENLINALGLAIKTIGAVITAYDPVTGPTTILTGEYLTQKLKEINGVSLKKFLETKGVPESMLDPFLESMAEESAQKILGLSGIRSVSGKEFKIVWYQDKSGVPLHATITKLNGEPLTEDERTLLSRLNILLDYDVVPKKEFKVGDSWTINASNIEEVFDPFVKGHFTGEINVSVKDKKESGSWSLEMSPSTLQMTSDAGKTIGNISVTRGEALIDPEKFTVDKVYAEGKADVNHVSHRHFLYGTTVEGTCTYKGLLTTAPIEESQPEGESNP